MNNIVKMTFWISKGIFLCYFVFIVHAAFVRIKSMMMMMI